MAENNMKTLNNGVKIPEIGFGVFRVTDAAECERIVLDAIRSGYRLIDTAAAYMNEEAVGRAIARSGIPREELFITTKLWVTDTSYEGARRGFEASLGKLGLDYVDLYLIHQPYNDLYGAWRALEELYAEGRVRAIGVDNFTSDRLADFCFFNKVKPAVNFIECNAFFQREAEREYMQDMDIQMQAWSPLAAGEGNLLGNEVLQNIASRHGRSVAQIVLRWLLQRNIIPIVKTSNKKRMEENLDIFSFSLSEDDMALIAALDTGHSCFSERNNGKSVEEFLKAAVSSHS